MQLFSGIKHKLFLPLSRMRCTLSHTVNKSSHKALSEELSANIIMNHMKDGLITFNEHGTIEHFNPAAEQIFGYSHKETLGCHLGLLFPETLPVDAILPFEDTDTLEHHSNNWHLAAISGNDEEIYGQRKNGKIFPIELSIGKTYLSSGIKYIANIRDITERKYAEQNLKRLAHNDPLTNLPNRNLFKDRMQYAIANARRNKQKFYLMFIDLDHFKAINDTYGHITGDQILKHVARRLTACTRENDTIARIGGDEFAVILTNIANQQHTKVIAKKILSLLSDPYIIDNNRLTLSASIGITQYPDDGKTINDLLKKSDNAMYNAKSRRNNFEFFSNSSTRS